LLEVVLALRAVGGLAHPLDGGQEQADEHGDDRYHHQQLDQREAAARRTGRVSCRVLRQLPGGTVTGGHVPNPPPAGMLLDYRPPAGGATGFPILTRTPGDSAGSPFPMGSTSGYRSEAWTVLRKAGCWRRPPGPGQVGPARAGSS